LPYFYHDDKVITTALDASLAQVNNEFWGVNLFRVKRSTVKLVNYLTDSKDDLDLTLEFGVRETICNKKTFRDPTTCNFKVGYVAMERSCTSYVQILEGQTRVLSIHCKMPSYSSSESSSSEEKFRRTWSPQSVRQDSGRFPSQLEEYGERNKKPNLGREREQWHMPAFE
ncbi:hypothetical protein GDO86_016990, partial [Hymenochirus boettgeri]